MEYLLIAAIYILGVGYHVMQKIGAIRAKFPDLHFDMVWKTFFAEEWNTLIVSALGLASVEIFWFIAHWKQIMLPEWLHGWGIYVFDLVAGYALQRLIYKYLGSTEKRLEKIAEDIANKN